MYDNNAMPPNTGKRADVLEINRLNEPIDL